MKNFLLFIIGFDLYPMIETLWRGRTHFYMGIVGGVCLVLMNICYEKMANKPLILKCIHCSLIITVIELIAGIILNIYFKLDIWDYSHLTFNFLGQICLIYTVLWGLIAIPAFGICKLTNIIIKNLKRIPA